MSASRVALPQQVRQAGVYYSQPVFVPAEATYVTVMADNRAGWAECGLDETVVELTIEMDCTGTWALLGACTTDASRDPGRDGQVVEMTTLRCRLPRARIPEPQVRVVLRCLSPCEGAVTLVFDEAPVPRQARSAHHSVTYDNDNEVTATSGTSVTIGAFAVGNQANRCMVVGAASYSATSANGAFASVAHNGSTTGWAAVVTVADTPATQRVTLWRKVAPDVTTATVVVTCAGACSELAAHALSVYDVDQTTPMGTPVTGLEENVPTAAPSVTATAATGDLVYDFLYTYVDGSLTHTITEGAGQTVRANNVLATYSLARSVIGASSEPGAASVVMAWTMANTSTSIWWTQVACAIKAAAAAGHPAMRRMGGIQYGPRRGMQGVF